MKRTLEWIVAISGTLMGLLLMIIGVALLILDTKQSYLDVLYNKWSNDEYERLLELMQNINTDWILPGGISVIFGGILMYCLKKDIKLIAMGWISIAVAAFLSFMSAFGSIPAFFFLIIGLIILVRKAASMEHKKIT